MDFGMSAEIGQIRKELRKFIKKEIAPNERDWDERHYFPYNEVIKPLGQMGMFGTIIPDAYGGNGLRDGWLAAMVITEELARSLAALRVQVNMQELGCAYPILKYGSDAAKQKYIAKLVSGEYLGGFAITEPDAGTDVMSMQAEAVDDGSHWTMIAGKTWISNAQTADILVVYAYTDRSKGSRGMSAFLVEPKNFNGVATSSLEKLGVHSSPTGELFLDHTKIPKENILGKPGDGAKILFSSLNSTRLSAAAGAVGLARRCLDEVVKYAKQREQFGKKIGEFQMNQDLVAQMATEIEAARFLVYRAAWEKDQGRLNMGKSVAMAKLSAGEVVNKCAICAMRFLGAYGYSPEYPVARLYRDAPSTYIVEGSINACKMIIAQDALGIRKANRK